MPNTKVVVGGAAALLAAGIGTAVALVATSQPNETSYYLTREEVSMPPDLAQAILKAIPGPEVLEMIQCQIPVGEQGTCTATGWNRVTEANAEQAAGKTTVKLSANSKLDAKTLRDAHGAARAAERMANPRFMERESRRMQMTRERGEHRTRIIDAGSK